MCSLDEGKVLLGPYRDDFTEDVYFGNKQPLFRELLQRVDGQTGDFFSQAQIIMPEHIPPSPFFLYYIY